MQDKLRQAQEYKDRAERLRAIARDLAKSERGLLMQLADEYDQMARSVGLIARAEVTRAVGSDGAAGLDSEGDEMTTQSQRRVR
jgi:hypothetical protein